MGTLSSGILMDSMAMRFPPRQLSQPLTSRAIAITRGGGLNATAGGNSFNSNGWNTTDDTDFLTFWAYDCRRLHCRPVDSYSHNGSSNTGPGTLELFSSVDNFGTSLFTFNQPGNPNLDSTIDLSSLTDLSGTITFQIVESGNTQADGSGTTASGGTFPPRELQREFLDPNHIERHGDCGNPRAHRLRLRRPCRQRDRHSCRPSASLRPSGP